jgi:hypothetical protein
VRAYSFLIQSAAEFNQLSTRGRFRRVMFSLDAVKSIRAQAIRPVVSMERGASFASSIVSTHRAVRDIRTPSPKSPGGSPQISDDYRNDVRGIYERAELGLAKPVSYGGYNIYAIISEDGDWFANVRLETEKYSVGSENRHFSFKTASYLSKSLAIADAQIWIDERSS